MVAEQTGPEAGGDGARRDRRVPRPWCWDQLPRLESQLHGGVLELHYRPSVDNWKELEVLVDAEQAASPYVTWILTARSGRLIVEIHAPPDRPDDVRTLAVFVQALDRNTATAPDR